jgi:hypothetical protein
MVSIALLWKNGPDEAASINDGTLSGESPGIPNPSIGINSGKAARLIREVLYARHQIVVADRSRTCVVCSVDVTARAFRNRRIRRFCHDSDCP